VINNRSQGNITEHLRCDALLYYKFIIQSAGERIFGPKCGEYLVKLRTKWLVVSRVPFALHFCPQRCRTRHISRITRV